MRILGKKTARLVVVGNAASKYDWDKERVMSDQARDIVFDFLQMAGFDLDDVLYVPCFASPKLSGLKLDGAALRADADEHLIPLLLERNRRLVLALGNNALCAVGVTDKPEGVNGLKRRRLSSPMLPGVEIVASIDPYFIQAKPDDNDEDFFADLAFAKRIFDGRFEEQAPMSIEDLETPESVNKLILEIPKHPILAYDVETSELDRLEGLVVSCAFHNGVQTKASLPLVRFWGGFDRLRPRFEDHILDQFVEAFTELFMHPDVQLGGWNMKFDDGIIASNLDLPPEFPGCTYDGKIYKWCINKHGFNGLKECTSRCLGYTDYDEPVAKAVGELARRRGRVMYESNPDNADDFFVLKWAGIEPTPASFSKKKGQGYRWPKGVDRKFAAWAMIDYPTLRLYNCLGGDTQVLTREHGVIPIRDLAGACATVRDGNGEWVDARFDSYGTQPTRELMFATTLGGVPRRSVRATDEHAWYLLDGTRVLTKDLIPGMVIPNSNRRWSPDESSEEYRRGVQHGLVYGDGTTIKVPRGTRVLGYQIRLCGTDAENLHWFVGDEGVKVYYPPSAGGDPVVIMRGPTNKERALKHLPHDVSMDYLTGFFRGWLSADGCIDSKPSRTITLCVGPEEAAWLRQVLPILGVEFGAYSLLSPGTYPGAKKIRGNLRIENYSLLSDDFLLAQKRARFSPVNSHFVYRGCGEEVLEEEVFCAVVPTTQSFTLEGGILTGNCYDALYTFKNLVEVFMPQVEQDPKLQSSVHWRHKFSRRLLKAELKGMVCDVEKNREISKLYEEVIAESKIKITEEAVRLAPDITDFNPNSHPQLRKVLFGEPVQVPHIDERSLCDYWDRKSVKEKLSMFHDRFYRGYGELEKAVKDRTYDYKRTRESLIKAFDQFMKGVRLSFDAPTRDNYSDDLVFVGVEDRPVFLNGLYRPDPKAFTDSGLPGVGASVLKALYETKEEPFLHYVLMHSKASKLKGTFVDGVYQRLDRFGVLHAEYNEIGAKTGRLSGRNPNPQNFTPYLRGQLIARPGHRFVTFDLSQAEIRVVAALANDTDLMAAMYQGDFHTNTASMVTGIPVDEVDKVTRGYFKAQPLTAKVLTPTGWKTMGDLRVGDFVIGADGLATQVLGVHPRGKRRLYSITFDDGTTVQCDKEHLWSVVDAKTKCQRTLTVGEMMQDGMRINSQSRFSVKAVEPVHYMEQCVPLHPYAVGVLLGDGHIKGSSFCSVDTEIVARVQEVLPTYEVIPVKREGKTRAPVYRIKHKHAGGRGKYGKAIRAIFKGFDESHAWNSHSKRIPKEYLFNTVANRLELLRGLMDTDGTIGKGCNAGRPTFTTVSKGMAEDFMELVRSLGGKATVFEEQGRYHLPSGEKVETSMFYRVGFGIDHNPFFLSRKAEGWRKQVRPLRFFIRSVEDLEEEVEMQCISVAHPEHLYVTDTYKLTHNTLNFGLIYGMSAFRLAMSLGITVEEAEDLMARYFARFPKLCNWIQTQRENILHAPYFAETSFGTRLHLRNALSSDYGVREHALRVAVNMPVQGTAGELTLWYIEQIHERWAELYPDVPLDLLNTTHDSGTFELLEEYAWSETAVNERGETYEVAAGPLVDLIKKIINEEAVPFAPLDTVSFKCDIDVTTHWYGETQPLKALDAEFGTEKQKLPWHLILGEATDEEEKEDLEEVILMEEVYEAQRAG